jgi:thymidylate synthase
MSEGYDEFDMEDEGPDYNNISDLEDELRRLIRFSNQYGSKGADAKIEQLKQIIAKLKNQVNEDMKIKMTKKDLKEVIREQIKSLIK